MNSVVGHQLTDDSQLADIWNALIDSIREEYLSESQCFPWIVGFSGGKDSTLVAHAIFEMLLTIPPSARKRSIHIVSNDTLVESPLVISHLNAVTAQISDAATSMGLPITVARTTPELEKTFWVLLIGKGYPSPNLTMRWCTDRLKILPTSNYIKANVSKHGSAIIVLGVRRDESTTRQRSIDRYSNSRGSNLAPHNDLPDAFIYRPIVDFSTDEVWETLATYAPPWGGTHRSLIKLYRDALGGECPVVISHSDAPSCGTTSSRFGCWTCTVVEKDKSLQGFVDSGNIQYEPLIAFRDWLKSIRNNPKMRQAFRRNGKLTFDADGKHIPGPFTIQARREILERLMAVQTEFGHQLISSEEIDLIHKHWASELQEQRDLVNG